MGAWNENARRRTPSSGSDIWGRPRWPNWNTTQRFVELARFRRCRRRPDRCRQRCAGLVDLKVACSPSYLRMARHSDEMIARGPQQGARSMSSGSITATGPNATMEASGTFSGSRHGKVFFWQGRGHQPGGRLAPRPITAIRYHRSSAGPRRGSLLNEAPAEISPATSEAGFYSPFHSPTNKLATDVKI